MFYGLLQAARQCWKTLLSIMRSRNDICLLIRVSEEGTVILLVYVIIVLRYQKTNFKAISDIGKEFSIAHLESMTQ